jgi:hypothetical protein
MIVRHHKLTHMSAFWKLEKIWFINSFLSSRIPMIESRDVANICF